MADDFVIAIDFGGTKVDVATAALDGRLLLGERIDTDAGQGAGQAVDRAIGTARELAERTAAGNGSRCVGVGATSPGIVLDDGVLLAPNVPGWDALALRPALRDGLGVDPIVATDVKAAALAEVRWGALAGADPAIFLSLGTGIAAAIVAGGQVVGGAHGAAGEIGYALRGLHDEIGAPDGRAPLEEHVGGRALGERATRLLGEPLDAAALFARAEHDVEARLLVDEALAELGLHVANLAIALDPRRIAVGGGLMGAAPLVLAALQRRTRLAPFPPEVVEARFVHDGALRGAVALALDGLAASSPTRGDAR
jgi:glucokinase